MSAISGSLGVGRCIFIVSRQNPVLVGYFYALFSHVTANGNNIAVFLQYHFVAIGEIHLAIIHYVLNARYQILDGREVLVIDMFVENMAESSTIITPNHINIANVLSVKNSKQVSTFVINQELHSLKNFALELVIHTSKCAASNRLWFIAFMLTITELRLSKPCLSPHHLGIGCIKHIGLASVFLAFVGFVQDKRPFLIAPFLLARDFQTLQQFLQYFLEHGLQLAPERKFLGTHLLKAFLTDASCKVCSVLLRSITLELLAFLACLGMSLCHVRIVGGVAVLALGLMLLAFLLAESVHLCIVHFLCRAVNGVPYLVFRHAVEFIKGIVQFLLFGEQHTQSVMPNYLMDKRVLNICHVGIVRHNDGYFSRHRVKAAFHSALACTR